MGHGSPRVNICERENDSDFASEMITGAQVDRKCEIEISLPHLSPASVTKPCTRIMRENTNEN